MTVGNLYFCFDISATEQSLGYRGVPKQHAEGKAGHNRKNIVGSFIPLIMTIVGEHIASKNLPPHFLGAFDAEKMSFLHYNAVLEAGFASVADLVSYDANGRISSISNAEAVVEYTYMPDGLDAGYVLTLSNGVSFTRSVSRDAYRRGLVTSITNRVAFPVDGSISPDASYYLGYQNGGLTNSYVYSYDALSRPVRRNGSVFGYNARSEVTHDGSIGAWYSYDEIGNNTSYTANELNQYIGTAYSHSGETVEEYSPNGEMLAYGDWRYCYDAKSRLVSVSEWRYTDFENPYSERLDEGKWVYEQN